MVSSLLDLRTHDRIVVYSPQLWENYTLQSGQGLSVVFVVIWLLGDVCCLAGALIAQLVPTVIILAVYVSSTHLLHQTVHQGLMHLASVPLLRLHAPIPDILLSLEEPPCRRGHHTTNNSYRRYPTSRIHSRTQTCEPLEHGERGSQIFAIPHVCFHRRRHGVGDRFESSRTQHSERTGNRCGMEKSGSWVG